MDGRLKRPVITAAVFRIGHGENYAPRIFVQYVTLQVNELNKSNQVLWSVTVNKHCCYNLVRKSVYENGQLIGLNRNTHASVPNKQAS